LDSNYLIFILHSRDTQIDTHDYIITIFITATTPVDILQCNVSTGNNKTTSSCSGDEVVRFYSGIT